MLYNHPEVDEVKGAWRLKGQPLKPGTGRENRLEMLTCPRTTLLNLVAHV